MNLLPEKFTSLEFEHTLIERIGNVAIYRRQKGTARPHFEVIKVQSHGAGERTFGGKTVQIEAGESYPTAARWGTEGWTYTDLDEAHAKFMQLASAQ